VVRQNTASSIAGAAASWEEGGVLPEHCFEGARLRAFERARLNEDLHSHGLKTTFGTRFLQANHDEAREFADLMEHSDPFSQVMKYALPDEKRAKAEMARLQGFFPHLCC
jgi:integrase